MIVARTFFLIFFLFLSGGLLASSTGGSKSSRERIRKEQLNKNDRLFRYTVHKPCWLDKHRYFCCPVRKIVRRPEGRDKWTDYCYNENDELIGIWKRNNSSSVRRSQFTSLSGCTRCRNTSLKQRSWQRNMTPQLAPPKKAQRKRSNRSRSVRRSGCASIRCSGK